MSGLFNDLSHSLHTEHLPLEDRIEHSMRREQEDKELAACEYFESQAASQPEPINNYSEKRGS